MRLDRANGGWPQHRDHVTGKDLPCLDIAGRAQTATLHNLCLLLISGDELIGGAEGAFEDARLFDHVRPICGVQRKLVVGTFTIVVVGKMTFNDARSQCHRAEDGCVAVGVIGETEHHAVVREQVAYVLDVVVGDVRLFSNVANPLSVTSIS